VIEINLQRHKIIKKAYKEKIMADIFMDQCPLNMSWHDFYINAYVKKIKKLNR
jgi:hypothetical protein